VAGTDYKNEENGDRDDGRHNDEEKRAGTTGLGALFHSTAPVGWMLNESGM